MGAGKLKGYLKPIIIKFLDREKGKTGSELVEEIEKELNSRPSYGSLYPLLQKLEKEGLVEMEKIGREKRYTLSGKGQDFVNELEKRKKEHTECIIHALRTYKTIFEEEEMELIIENLEKEQKQGKPTFPELFQIYHFLMAHKTEGKKEKIRKELRKTLENLTEILEVNHECNFRDFSKKRR